MKFEIDYNAYRSRWPRRRAPLIAWRAVRTVSRRLGCGVCF